MHMKKMSWTWGKFFSLSYVLWLAESVYEVGFLIEARISQKNEFGGLTFDHEYLGLWSA